MEAGEARWTVDRPPFDAERLFSLMERQKVDLVLVSSRHNTRYLTGGYFYPLFMWDSHTRRTQHLSFLALLPGSLEKAFFVGRPTEKLVMEEADVWVRPCHEAGAIGIRPTVETTAELLRKHSLDRGRIALEITSLPADALLALRDELPDAEFVEASGILDALRAVKSQREIEIIREGARLNLAAVTEALREGSDGQSTAEIEAQVARGFASRGLHFLYSLVCAGPHFFRAASPKRFWTKGNCLHIDSGGLIEGYVAEVCRMGHLGEPSRLADDLLGACRDLRDDALTVFTPGTAARDIQEHANAYLSRTRFGDKGKFIAHGIGMVHHEDPVVSLASDHVLEPGMVLSIEMEYRHADVGHVKIEELIAITADGVELLTPNGEDWTLSEP